MLKACPPTTFNIYSRHTVAISASPNSPGKNREWHTWAARWRRFSDIARGETSTRRSRRSTRRSRRRRQPVSPQARAVALTNKWLATVSLKDRSSGVIDLPAFRTNVYSRLQTRGMKRTPGDLALS